MRNSRIRLPPWVFDVIALIRPEMQDSRLGQPRVGDTAHSSQSHRVLLTALAQRAPPQVRDVKSERLNCAAVGGDGVVRKVPGDTLLQAVIPAMLAAQQRLLAPLSEADRPQFMCLLKTVVNASNGLSRAPSDA